MSLIGSLLTFTRRGLGQHLKSVSSSIHATIRDLTSAVTLTQEFTNDSDGPQDIIYRFQMHSKITISDFCAEIDGRKVHGLLKRIKEVDIEYEDAVTSGYQAFLSRKWSQQDIFEVSLGNISAGKSVRLHLSYLDFSADIITPSHCLSINSNQPIQIRGNKVKSRVIPRLEFTLEISSEGYRPDLLYVEVDEIGDYYLLSRMLEDTEGVTIGHDSAMRDIAEELEDRRLILDVSGTSTRCSEKETIIKRSTLLMEGSEEIQSAEKKKEMIRISFSTGVLCPYTAFIAVDRDSAHHMDQPVRCIQIEDIVRHPIRNPLLQRVSAKKERKHFDSADWAVQSTSTFTNVRDIMCHQHVSGFFEKKVLACLDLREERVMELVPVEGTEATMMFITAIVMIYLERRCRDQKKEWMVGIEKARDWMRRTAEMMHEKEEKWFVAAEALVFSK
ncbi:von Willebrand factor A domain-containing protein 5A-like [Planoprotostelium fungivorum]|uniref:von Willebrand factor A domain-containing protein 5A-like n=1 Tax=Planoprotostelium fungivorum TaxID=1890364 RepID=A0A2P6N5D3_9EUKA|nr:von Willebrand factor A domain-containing protein 5A-like [Planoprotostelium fungivorum]